MRLAVAIVLADIAALHLIGGPVIAAAGLLLLSLSVGFCWLTSRP